MFAEGADAMNNSLKGSYFPQFSIQSIQAHNYLDIPPVAQFAERLELTFCFKL